MLAIMTIASSDIQFFFDRKILIRDSASRTSCLPLGIISEPFSSFQP